MQTENQVDTAQLRHSSLTGSSVRLMVEEETSQDAEVFHTVESIAYLTVETGFPGSLRLTGPGAGPGQPACGRGRVSDRRARATWREGALTGVGRARGMHVGPRLKGGLRPLPMVH